MRRDILDRLGPKRCLATLTLTPTVGWTPGQENRSHPRLHSAGPCHTLLSRVGEGGDSKLQRKLLLYKRFVLLFLFYI